MEIINPSDNVLDLGIFMSSNCSFEFLIQTLCKKCSNLSGWILRTFTTRDYFYFYYKEEFIKQKFYKKKNKQNYYKNKINYNIHYLHLS